ncbi:hypothetical protein [Pedobacter nototheniae]|uniref:hypothetical protein n=1 Tax=Pedobacter nototheniae TaxID=2488994 RepID=UPI00103F477E|nr:MULTISPECIES: hypothetical protein [Pedobacter]
MNSSTRKLSRLEMKNVLGGVGPGKPRCNEQCLPWANSEMSCEDQCGSCNFVQGVGYICQIPLDEK